MVDKNDLRVVGKEILGNQNNMRVSQEKEESKVDGKTSIVGKESGLDLDRLNDQLKELNKENTAVDPDN